MEKSNKHLPFTDNLQLFYLVADLSFPLLMDQLVLQVNSNGFLTFDSGWARYSPYRFPGAGRNIVSPFWTDLDNRYSGTISYREHTSGGVLQQASTDINQYFPGIGFSASWVFVATWDRVEYYSSSGTVNQFFLKTFTFYI